MLAHQPGVAQTVLLEVPERFGGACGLAPRAVESAVAAHLMFRVPVRCPLSGFSAGVPGGSFPDIVGQAWMYLVTLRRPLGTSGSNVETVRKAEETRAWRPAA